MRSILEREYHDVYVYQMKFEEAKLKVKRDHEKKLEEDRNKSLKEWRQVTQVNHH